MTCFCQMAEKARSEFQTYLQDSATVFWTQYPDPFSHPTYRDRRVLSQAISFHCELPGIIEVGFFDARNDSTIHQFRIHSSGKADHTFWVWCASPSADPSTIPEDRFLSISPMPLELVLIVDGKKKTMFRMQFNVPAGYYCYLHQI